VNEPIRYRILGPLEVDGRPVPGPQQRALLAMLLLNRDRIVSITELAAEIWPDKTPDQMRRNTLHAQVARLRSNLKQTLPIYAKSGGYQLTGDPSEVDTFHFYQLRRAARTQDPQQAIVTLDTALALWRGDALQDAVLGRRCQAAAVGLQESRLQAHEEVAWAHVKQHTAVHVVDGLAGLAVLHPMRETLLAALMAALDGCGRRVEALTVFQQARERFTAALGVEPGEVMRQQHVRILQGGVL